MKSPFSPQTLLFNTPSLSQGQIFAKLAMSNVLDFFAAASEDACVIVPNGRPLLGENSLVVVRNKLLWRAWSSPWHWESEDIPRPQIWELFLGAVLCNKKPQKNIPLGVLLVNLDAYF